VANLKKTMSPDSPAARAEKQQKKRAAKAANDQPAKSD
jgi:hypothetical protein